MHVHVASGFEVALDEDAVAYLIILKICTENKEKLGLLCGFL